MTEKIGAFPGAVHKKNKIEKSDTVEQINDSEKIESVPLRREEGEILFVDDMEKTLEAKKDFLAAINGFCRDIAGVKKSGSIVRVNLENHSKPFSPPATSNENAFSILSQTLVRVGKVFEGSIELKGSLVDKKARDGAKLELMFIHHNLEEVGKAAKFLFESLSKSSLHFYSFNGNNGEEYKDANIKFDEDSLTVSISAARAIMEKAVKLDIDVVSGMNKIDDQENAVKEMAVLGGEDVRNN